MIARMLARLLGGAQPRRTFNLLGPDLLAEVTLHLTVAGERKAIVSKLEESPDSMMRQKVIQALVFTAIDLAKERQIGINWQGLAQVYPYKGPAAVTPAPPPAPGG